MDITEVTVVHHAALVLAALWAAAAAGWAHPALFLVALLYIFAVNQRYTMRLWRRIQYEERKCANQRKLLSDAETVRWLNYAVEKIWPVCMERVASQQFLLPIFPWFLEKFKPWTARKAVIQSLYLGRNPPMFTDIRVVNQSTDDDHLVLEIGMNFLSADDMDARMAVQLRKRLGFGITTNMHITGMHVEGKVLVGVRFLRQWPFIGRVRVCFVEPPYFQMTVKPLFGHGLDVTELPGISGWLDRMLDVAFGQTLVEPNMLVIDLEKFASESTGNSGGVSTAIPAPVLSSASPCCRRLCSCNEGGGGALLVRTDCSTHPTPWLPCIWPGDYILLGASRDGGSWIVASLYLRFVVCRFDLARLAQEAPKHGGGLRPQGGGGLLRLICNDDVRARGGVGWLGGGSTAVAMASVWLAGPSLVPSPCSCPRHWIIGTPNLGFAYLVL